MNLENELMQKEARLMLIEYVIKKAPYLESRDVNTIMNLIDYCITSRGVDYQ